MCFGVSCEYCIPAFLWCEIESILQDIKKEKIKAGRPRVPDKQAMTAIFYLMRTGIQWNALPHSLGKSSTIHDRFQEWEEAGVFTTLWKNGVISYNEKKGIKWQWQSMDGSIVQAPNGGDKTGPSYKHKGKSGTNRSALVDGRGVPLAMVIEKANKNDMKMTRETLNSFIVPKPTPEEIEQNLCLDKGYDYPEVDEIVKIWGYVPHIRRREEIVPEEKTHKPRRWVVERTHAWINDFRRLFVRWERKSKNYLGFLHLCFAVISFRSARTV